MNQWMIYEMLKGNRQNMTLEEIEALEKENARMFREAVIEFLLAKKRTGWG